MPPGRSSFASSPGIAGAELAIVCRDDIDAERRTSDLAPRNEPAALGTIPFLRTGCFFDTTAHNAVASFGPRPLKGAGHFTVVELEIKLKIAPSGRAGII